MKASEDSKAICSVRQMAEKIKLSRQRFYQLMQKGVFPQPVYSIETRRPFYTLSLQRMCLRVRETGIGIHGQPVIFYDRHAKPARPLSEMPDDEFDRVCTELAEIVSQMGNGRVKVERVKAAINKIYPHGLKENKVDGDLIKNVFLHLNAKA